MNRESPTHVVHRKPIGQGDALLIVDMVNRFDFEGGEALALGAVRIAKTIRRLRDRFDVLQRPVIYVNDNFMQWQADFRDLIAVCAQATGPCAEILRHLAPVRGHYHVLKPKHSAFLDTPLSILLAKLDIRRVIVAGIAADSCIAITAQDAKMRELDVWVPGDCVAAISPARKRGALQWLRSSAGIDTAPTSKLPKSKLPQQLPRPRSP